MSNANVARQIKRTDELIAKFEAKTVQSVEKAMDAAFQKLEKEFRRKWLALESRDLAGQDRAILLIEQIKQYLEILPSDSDHIQKLYEDLALDSQRAGIEFGANAIESITGFTAATVKPNLKAIAFQAEDASKRLYRHSADFQIRASQVIQQGLVSGSGVAKVAEQLRRELGVTKSKAETIARTESMAATDSATRDMYRQNGIGYVQRISTQDDRICPYCAARAGNVYPINKAPAILHPRDRCFNSPFSPDWVDAGLIDQAWLKKHREQSIAALGDKQPDYGASPFEQMAGQFAPKPIWTVVGGFAADFAKPTTVKVSATKTSESSTFTEIEGLSQLKEWRAAINLGKKYEDLGYERYELQKINSAIDAFKSEDPKKKELWKGKNQAISLILADLENDKSYREYRINELIKKNKLNPEANTERIADSLRVVDWLKDSKNDKDVSTGGVSIDGKLAAAFAYKDAKTSVFVELLAANPSDVISGQGKGAGTAALKILVQKSIEAGYDGKLTLQAMRGSEGFYKKRGFKLIDSKENIYELDSSGAKQILELKG